MEHSVNKNSYMVRNTDIPESSQELKRLALSNIHRIYRLYK